MVPVVLGGRHLPCLAWEPCSRDQVPVWAGVPGRDSAQVRAAQWCWQSCVRADRDSPASGAVVMAAVTHTHLRPIRQPAAAGAQVGGGTPKSRIAQACSLTAAVGTMGIWPSLGPCGMTAPQDCLGHLQDMVKVPEPGPGPSPPCRAALHPHCACCEPGQSPCNGAGPHLLPALCMAVTQAVSHHAWLPPELFLSPWLSGSSHASQEHGRGSAAVALVSWRP